MATNYTEVRTYKLINVVLFREGSYDNSDGQRSCTEIILCQNKGKCVCFAILREENDNDKEIGSKLEKMHVFSSFLFILVPRQFQSPLQAMMQQCNCNILENLMFR